MPKCDRCTLSRDFFVPADGPKPAKIMIVGEAPGREEVEQRRPFVGGAGRVLSALLKAAGLNRKEIYITNVVKCRPPNNRTPLPEEVECCKDLLQQEIEEVNPEWIIALGETAARWFDNKFYPIGDWRGHVCKWNGRYLLITFHPAYVMRKRTSGKGADLFTIVTNDLHRVKTKPKFLPAQYKVDPPPEELELYLSKGGVTAIDIETTDLNPWKDDITAIAFCNEPGHAISVRWSEEYLPIIRKFLESDTPKVYHHMAFDVLFKKVKGFKTRNIVWDTQLAAHWIWSDGPLSLDFLRSLYTTIPPYKKAIKRRGLFTLSRQEFGEMNCADVDATLRVYYEQRKLLKPDVMHYLLKLEYQAMTMRERGVKFDKRRAAARYLELGPRVQEIEDKFMREHGVLISSPKQLLQWLHSKRIWVNSTRAEELEDYLEKKVYKEETRKLISEILEYRKLSKALSTYIKGIFPLLEETTSRVHPNWNTCGTDGSRWACSDPNLMNVPLDLRDLYVPSEPYTFYGADYRNLEFYVAGLLAGEYEIVDKIQKGEDIHEEIRQEAARYYPSVTRSQAKAIVFGTIYGRSAHSICRELGIPLDAARKLQDMCMRRFPKLVKRREQQLEFWRKHGYVESFHRRRKYCSKPTEALNSAIQSTAAEVAINALLKLEEEGFRPVILVHDQIVCEAPKNKSFERFVEIMETSTPALCERFPVKAKKGGDWKEVS